MASRRIEDLIPEMQDKANFVVGYCKNEGVDLLVYCTLRTLKEQAILFRSSDPDGGKVKSKILWLRNNGFDFLADKIEEINPQKYEGWKTNAAPGESYHNYGEAFDAVPMLGGKPMWGYKSYQKGWDTFGKACKEINLEWGGTWSNKDMPHAQLRPIIDGSSNPLKMSSPEEVKFILTKNGLL